MNFEIKWASDDDKTAYFNELKAHGAAYLQTGHDGLTRHIPLKNILLKPATKRKQSRPE